MPPVIKVLHMRTEPLYRGSWRSSKETFADCEKIITYPRQGLLNAHTESLNNVDLIIFSLLKKYYHYAFSFKYEKRNRNRATRGFQICAQIQFIFPRSHVIAHTVFHMNMVTVRKVTDLKGSNGHVKCIFIYI
jgi:hypothetical protein